MKTWQTKVLTVNEFKALLLKWLLHDAQHHSHEQIFETLLNDGFPKFNVESLGVFMNGLKCRVFMEPYGACLC